MRCHRAARRSRTRAATAMVALALGIVSGTARADTSFALSWRSKPGAAACVTEARLRDAVEKKLGRDPFTDRARADIVIEGEELSGNPRFRARVLQRGRNGAVLGSRELDAESCSSLLLTTTIVVALFIEPGGRSEPRAMDPEPPDEDHAHAHTEVSERSRDEVPAAKARSPTREARSTPAPPKHAPLDLSFGVGGAASIGLLPSVAAGLRVVVRLESTRWSFEWSGGYWLPQSFQSGSVRGTFSAVDQQARACLSLAPQLATRLDACGGVFWGAIVPSTMGVRERNDTWRPLAGPLAAVAAQLREGRGAARLEIGVTAPVARRALYYEGAGAEPERVHATATVLIFAGVSGLLTIF